LLLKKLAGKNYFVALIILLGITILLVVSIFILTALTPGTLGNKPHEYTISSVCEFEPWFFDINDLEVYFPEGGIITTLAETDRDRSIMLLGKGLYKYNDDRYNEESVSGFFIVIENDLFEKIRRDNLFIPVEDQNQLNMVSDVFDKQKGLPSVWNDKIPITFQPYNDFLYFYFISPEGKPLLPPAVEYNLTSIFSSALVYILFAMIMLIIITIFTLDYQYSRYWIYLAKNPPGLISMFLVPIVTALFIASEITPELYNWPDNYSVFGYSLIIIILIIYSRYDKNAYLDLGLRRDRIRHGYILALLSAAFIIMATRGLPSGLDIESFDTPIYLLLPFILIALPREIIWRGYIQTVLSRRLGPNWGLFIMILLVAVSRYFNILITEPWMIAYPYTYLEIAILAPATAAILGYLYLRTENILSCALLHSLLIILPGVIQY